MASVKVRLIERLREEAKKTNDSYYHYLADQLEERGSGSLPWWARERAKEWGIT